MSTSLKTLPQIEEACARLDLTIRVDIEEAEVEFVINSVYDRTKDPVFVFRGSLQRASDFVTGFETGWMAGVKHAGYS